MKPKFSVNTYCSNGLLQLIYSLSQFIVPLLLTDWVVALKSLKESPCGNTSLSGPKGTITSPNYPSPYPNEIKCEWKIHSPEESILKITIVDLDIEEDYSCHKPPCCSNQWLLVLIEGERRSKYCGNSSAEKTITASQPVTLIKYFSSGSNRGRRGFEIVYSIDVKACNAKRVCSEGREPCPLSPGHCYSQLEVCDEKFDCPKGEDEVSCAPGCPKQIACASGDGCYFPSQRCNFIKNCTDNSDEIGCPPEPCVALQFTCLNGACVPGSALCDGDDDCGDLSDEENCSKSSFMTAAIIGLLSCIFLFCIGLSCLYRVYVARLRASASFAHQLEPEPTDDEFMYREPPPAYSVAIGDAGIIPYPTPEFMERYFEAEQTSHPHRSRNP